MDNTQLLTAISSVIILICLAAAVIIYLKRKPNSNDRELARNYLVELSDEFYIIMLNVINKTNVREYNTFIELEAGILSTIYDEIWNVLEPKLEEAAQKDILTAMALKVLNRAYVDRFIEDLIKNKHVESEINDRWMEILSTKSKSAEDVENEDKNLSDQYNSNDYIDDIEKENGIYEESEEYIPTEDELSELNPPRDEEEEYDPEDSSMEIVTEEETEVTWFIDTYGRKRDKKTGRWTK